MVRKILKEVENDFRNLFKKVFEVMETEDLLKRRRFENKKHYIYSLPLESFEIKETGEMKTDNLKNYLFAPNIHFDVSQEPYLGINIDNILIFNCSIYLNNKIYDLDFVIQIPLSTNVNPYIFGKIIYDVLEKGFFLDDVIDVEIVEENKKLIRSEV